MARSFSGTDQINIGSPASLPNAASAVPFTMSAWVFPTSSSHDGNIFLVNGGGAEIMELRFNRSLDGFVSWNVVNQTNTLGQAKSTSSCASLLNAWFHLAGTWDGSNLRIYINGAQQAAPAFAGTSLTNSVGTGTWGIGSDPINGGPTFFGSTADCAVWRALLTAAEIAALAQGARPNSIRPSSLVGWWPVDGLQSPEPDLSGNKNNGTVTGTALAAGPPYMMFTPRWPQQPPFTTVAPSFSPAWARSRNIIIEGVAT